MNKTWLTLAILFGALVCAGRATGECIDLSVDPLSYDPSEEHRAVVQKKIQYAMTVISSDQELQQEPECVAKALFFLGRFQVEKAMPRMLALLTFEHRVVNPISARTSNQQYPAIAGLAGIGKPAVPALLGVIANSEVELERDNALWALTTIYSGHPKQVIDMLQKSADAEPDYAKASNYRDAASKVPRIACRGGDVVKCNE